MKLPTHVKIVEVGPRDGLQNEETQLSSAQKVDFINQLSLTGLSVIEVGAFVSAKKVPQMADSDAVFAQLTAYPDVSYPMLVPNQRGLERALTAGVQEIAVFASASETFSEKNIACSIAESLNRYEQVIKKARDAGMRVRGYVSCVLGCPYEGDVIASAVSDVASALYEQGCYEISLGDTIGVGTPLAAQGLIETVSKTIPIAHLAAHFHDTYGQALANLLAVMQMGIATIDASVAGLGGCPYARGATGNVATEDVVYCLDGMKIHTGVDLEKLLAVSEFVCRELGRKPISKVAQALLARI